MPKLNRFQKKDSNQTQKTLIISMGIILIGILSFCIYKTYAYYTQVEEHDVIKAKVTDFRKAKYTSYDNTNTGLNCTDDNATVQCALDELSGILGE